MKRKNLYLALATIAFSTPSWAADLDLEFVATINEPTCDMEISSATGGTLSGTVAGGYTLVIPDIELNKIQNADGAAEAKFRLLPKNCQSIAGISTTITTSETVHAASNLIVPSDTSTGKTKNIGMGFKQTKTTGDTFIKPNDPTSKIVWDETERADGVPMTVALRATTATTGDLRVGAFSAKATFNFSYE